MAGSRKAWDAKLSEAREALDWLARRENVPNGVDVPHCRDQMLARVLAAEAIGSLAGKDVKSGHPVWGHGAEIQNVRTAWASIETMHGGRGDSLQIRVMARRLHWELGALRRHDGDPQRALKWILPSVVGVAQALESCPLSDVDAERLETVDIDWMLAQSKSWSGKFSGERRSTVSILRAWAGRQGAWSPEDGGATALSDKFKKALKRTPKANP